MVEIRPLTPADAPFVWEALYHAIYVAAGDVPPAREIVQQPEIARYARHFGQQTGDVGVIALMEGQPVGAAWLRLMHGYGFVDAETPELTIAVLPPYQGQGVGTQLMIQLFVAATPYYRQISLSVTWDNPARRLYERLGFAVVSRDAGTATMSRPL